MNVTRLRTLSELARCGTMAAAAHALELTPSAVSQHISALEEEAGVALTQRSGRGVRLTPAGSVLARHAQCILRTLDAARAELAQLKGEIAGNLRVAAFASVAMMLLPPVIAQLAARYPRLHIQLDEMEANEGLAALESWRSDIALIDNLALLVGPQHENIASVPLLQDRLFALVPDAHVLARHSTCSLADLRHDTWALDGASSAFRVFIQQLCVQHGFEPRVRASVRSFPTILALVAAGCAVSVAPGLWLRQLWPGVHAIALQPEAGRAISAAYRRGESRHPAIQVFLAETVRASAALAGAE